MKKYDGFEMFRDFYARLWLAVAESSVSDEGWSRLARAARGDQDQDADERQLGDEGGLRSEESAPGRTTGRTDESQTPDRVDRLGHTWVRTGDEQPLTARKCGNPECTCADLPGPVGSWWLAVTGPLAELVNNGRPLAGEDFDEDQGDDVDEDADASEQAEAPAYDPLRPFSGPWSPFGPMQAGRTPYPSPGDWGALQRLTLRPVGPLNRSRSYLCDCPSCDRIRAQMSTQTDTPDH